MREYFPIYFMSPELPDTKTKESIKKKKQLQANVSNEHKHKNPQQNIPNQTSNI